MKNNVPKLSSNAKCKKNNVGPNALIPNVGNKMEIQPSSDTKC